MTSTRRRLSLRARACAAALALLLIGAAHAAQAPVEIESLTWTELRDRVAAGATTLLVPIGGTEQNGPHMALGKHNVRARVLAERIAQRLGNALVAPVIAYVPEGAISPPAGHMRFPGTISIPEVAFESMLEGTARSFRQHGFRDIVFLGDHGGYQKNAERVAAKLNRDWAADRRCRVHALTEYYRVTQTVYVAELKRRGFTEAQIGTHAGLADTALTLAIEPSLVREPALSHAAAAGTSEGVHGDPRPATAELGRVGTELIVASSVAAIRALTGHRDKTAGAPAPRR